MNYNLKKKRFFQIFYYIFVLLENILLKLPNFILCSSQNSYNILIKRYNVKKEKIDILKDGVDFELFNSNFLDKENIRKIYNINSKNKIILYT
jgi:hypothetical protein